MCRIKSLTTKAQREEKKGHKEEEKGEGKEEDHREITRILYN
jgi:hypothetical protein